MSTHPLRAPVAIFAFNRPELVAQVFARVREARPSRLFLVCDGPRDDRADEADKCAAVRRVLDGVDWPCTIERNYSDVNLGCRRRMSSGLDWVFSLAEEAIILEDDTLPDASFFPFCDALLERFGDDPRIQMIAGYNGLGRGATGGASYWFSAHPRIWGWASWRRAWEGYDVSMGSWPDIKATTAWTSRTESERRAWSGFFDAVKDGKIDTWDAQLTLHAWRAQRLVVIPATSLVTNLGFGIGSTNTHAAVFPGPPVVAMRFPLVHAARVERSARLDAEWVRREFRPRPGRLRRVLRRALKWVRGG